MTVAEATPGGQPNPACVKFQDLLRELFQFDSADLDFGVYRILNHKRDVIEKFVIEDLPAAVEEELDRGILKVQLLEDAVLTVLKKYVDKFCRVRRERWDTEQVVYDKASRTCVPGAEHTRTTSAGAGNSFCCET